MVIPGLCVPARDTMPPPRMAASSNPTSDPQSDRANSPLAFCVLASGSAGNCTVVFAESSSSSSSSPSARSCFLIDAGLSPRRTATLLSALGVALEDVSSIILTHFDADHFHAGWIRHIATRSMDGRPLRMHAHRQHRHAAWRAGLTARETSLFVDAVDLDSSAADGGGDGGVKVEAVLLAHDDLGSVGFVIEHQEHRLGYATDLGRVPRTLVNRFVNLHALCIESNYDPPMQEASARPAFLKRRIMDGAGHLSNQQTIQAVREIERRSRLSHIALLHLSRDCNCPKHVRGMWEREMPHAVERLTIAEQSRPTPLLRVTRPAAEMEMKLEMKQAMLFGTVV